MTEDEARSLLHMYAEGALEPDETRMIEGLLAQSPKLQGELDAIRAEPAPIDLPDDNLLSEALAPLRPSRSARMRLSEAMVDVHRRAEHVANTLPGKSWRIFRLGFSLFSIACAFLLMTFFPRPPVSEDETFLMGYATTGVFAVGITLLVAGRMMAHLETVVFGAMVRRPFKPTALEVLVLEVFGILCVVAAGVMYGFSLR